MSTCRVNEGPIPWNVIVEYGERKHLEPDNLEAFVRVIRALDASYLKDKDKKQTISGKETKPPPAPVTFKKPPPRKRPR